MFSSWEGYPSMMQASLVAATSVGNEGTVFPHHPITCQDGKLYYEEDCSFHCEHASVSPGDSRTRCAINHSMSLLIIELAMNL